jgi:GTP-binding protein HflX
VGFIRKLPHHLVASFRSTLEEITVADLVLHVVDRSHPQWREQMEVGKEVLADLGVDNERVLTVFNKSDRSGEPAGRRNGAVHISALSGEGLDLLKAEILRRLDGGEPSDGLPRPGSCE